MGKTFGPCACGCGEDITHEGSSYAGTDEATRNRHRAKAAYRRRQAGHATPGTREALAQLGLADDVPTTELAAVIAAASSELARRVTGLDSAAVARELEKGLADARVQVEAADARAAKATMQASKLADELAAAVARADQADQDAADAEERVAKAEAGRHEAEQTARDLHTRTQALVDQAATDAQTYRRQIHDAEDRATRAEALLPELTQRLQAEKATALAELRAELTERLGELRAELATARAEATAERARAERAEQRPAAPARRTTKKAPAGGPDSE